MESVLKNHSNVFVIQDGREMDVPNLYVEIHAIQRMDIVNALANVYANTAGVEEIVQSVSHILIVMEPVLTMYHGLAQI